MEEPIAGMRDAGIGGDPVVSGIRDTGKATKTDSDGEKGIGNPGGYPINKNSR